MARTPRPPATPVPPDGPLRRAATLLGQAAIDAHSCAAIAEAGGDDTGADLARRVERIASDALAAVTEASEPDPPPAGDVRRSPYGR